MIRVRDISFSVIAFLLVGVALALCIVILPTMSHEAYAVTAPAKASISKVSTSYAKVKVTWGGVSGASGYQVRISKSSKMTSSKKYTVKGGSARSKTITGAGAYTKYYVQVRAYKTSGGKNYFGSWSKVKGCITKNKVNYWSWSQLKTISNKISACSSRADAYAVAKKYGILRSDGKLVGIEAKSVKLSNGKTYKVRVIGIYQDAKAGGGRAGLTFEFMPVIGSHEMHPTGYRQYPGTNDGGWKSSEMRSWLSKKVYPMLPSDLRSAIVPVYKKTNNKGIGPQVSDVTKTSDRLWLPSFVEVMGSDNAVMWDSRYGKVLSSEGSQYLLYVCFAKAHAEIGGVFRARANHSWAFRSPDPSVDTNFIRADEWCNFGSGGAQYSFGAAPCFCL